MLCAPKNPKVFRLFFLKNNEHQGVEIEEVEKIDFEEIMTRIDCGESVFITSKHEQEPNPRSKINDKTKESWYFTHV